MMQLNTRHLVPLLLSLKILF